MPDSDKRHSPKKKLDDWEGVLLYRTIEGLLSKTNSDVQIDSTLYGDRLSATLLPEFVRQIEDHRDEIVGGLRSLQHALYSVTIEMTAKELRDWALFIVTRISDDAVKMAITSIQEPDEDFRQAIEDMDPEESRGLFRIVGRSLVEDQPLSIWEELLNTLRLMMSSGDLAEELVNQMGQVSFQGPAAIIAREKIWAIHEEVTANPANFGSILVEPNEALVESSEVRNQWGGNMEKAMEALWNSGARAGGPKETWEALTHDTFQENVRIPDGGFQDAFYRLFTTVDDVTTKNSLINLLQIGSKGKLISLLNKATYRDLLDERRHFKAQKREGDEGVFYISESEDFDVPDSEAMGIWSGVELAADLERIAKSSGTLSRREQEVLLLRLSVLTDSGELLTFEDLGARMGVTRGTAKISWERAMNKLREQLSMD